MWKYFMLAVVVLTITGCNKKEPVQKDEPQDAIKSEEKAESLTVKEQEQIEEKAVEQIIEQTEMKAEKDPITNDANLWKSYRSAKEIVKQAQTDKDYNKQTKYLLEAAKHANALKRDDIEAWQYNNVGYVLIEEFKEKTDYQKMMNKLNSLELLSEIIISRKEARIKFDKEKELLSKADNYLVKAKEIDSKLDESSRTKIIANNILFVNEVSSFLETGENE